MDNLGPRKYENHQKAAMEDMIDSSMIHFLCPMAHCTIFDSNTLLEWAPFGIQFFIVQTYCNLSPQRRVSFSSAFHLRSRGDQITHGQLYYSWNMRMCVCINMSIGVLASWGSVRNSDSTLVHKIPCDISRGTFRVSIGCSKKEFQTLCASPRFYF
jgi:hypothetical protein